MEISKDTLNYVAGLARIELTSEEVERLCLQLQEILDYIDKLTQLDVSQTAVTSHILPLSNVLRNDEPRSSLVLEKTLQNAPRKEGNFFVVPKVIE